MGEGSSGPPSMATPSKATPAPPLRRRASTMFDLQSRVAARALSRLRPPPVTASRWRRTEMMLRRETFTADMEESKVHFEMRALRSSRHHLNQQVTTYLLVLAIGLAAVIANGLLQSSGPVTASASLVGVPSPSGFASFFGVAAFAFGGTQAASA